MSDLKNVFSCRKATKWASLGAVLMSSLVVGQWASARTSSGYGIDGEEAVYTHCEGPETINYDAKIRFRIVKEGTRFVGGYSLDPDSGCVTKKFKLEDVKGFGVEVKVDGDIKNTFEPQPEMVEKKKPAEVVSGQQVEYAKLIDQGDTYRLEVCDPDLEVGQPLNVRYGGMQSLDVNPPKLIEMVELEGVDTKCMFRDDLTKETVGTKRIYLVYQEKLVGTLDHEEQIDNRVIGTAPTLPPQAVGDTSDEPIQSCWISAEKSTSDKLTEYQEIVTFSAACTLEESFTFEVKNDDTGESICRNDPGEKLNVPADGKVILCSFVRNNRVSEMYQTGLYRDNGEKVSSPIHVIKKVATHDFDVSVDELIYDKKAGGFSSLIVNQSKVPDILDLSDKDLKMGSKWPASGYEWVLDLKVKVSDDDLDAYSTENIRVEIINSKRPGKVKTSSASNGGYARFNLQAEYRMPRNLKLWGDPPEHYWDQGNFLDQGLNELEIRIYDAYRSSKGAKAPKVLKLDVNINPDIDKL